MSNNDNHEVRYAASTQKFGTALYYVACENITDTWAGFVLRASNPHRTNETVAEFDALVAKGKDGDNRARRRAAKLKASAGWFGGFHAKGGSLKDLAVENAYDGPYRDSASVKHLSMIVLDMDKSKKGDDYYDRLLAKEICPDIEWHAYSTKSDRPGAGRARVTVPLSHPMEATRAYQFARLLAQKFDPDLTHIDSKSFNEPQLMFWPSVSKDQPFRWARNHGKLVDGDVQLDAWFEENDNDEQKLPRCPDEEQVRIGALSEGVHPHDKPGIVGDFCRAFSIS